MENNMLHTAKKIDGEKIRTGSSCGGNFFPNSHLSWEAGCAHGLWIILANLTEVHKTGDEEMSH